MRLHRLALLLGPVKNLTPVWRACAGGQPGEPGGGVARGLHVPEAAAVRVAAQGRGAKARTPVAAAAGGGCGALGGGRGNVVAVNMIACREGRSGMLDAALSAPSCGLPVAS